MARISSMLPLKVGITGIRMLTKAEVKELFGVCDATLWHWANKGILKPVKTGNKIMYPEYEVRKALGQRNINI